MKEMAISLCGAGGSLAELKQPERMRTIEGGHARRLAPAGENLAGLTLSEVDRRREKLDDPSSGDAWMIGNL